jgi:NAD(P)-dependent dehydrogenase (short-subunit alcohol dehydrogenase family)
VKTLPDLFDLTGRVAIVTGGAGLLGEEFCRTLIEAGAITVIADIDGDAADDLANSLNGRFQAEASERRAVAAQVDISSKSSVQGLFQFVFDQFKQLDILVNAAALDPKFDPRSLTNPGEDDADHPLGRKFEDYPLEQWQRALDVNLTGVFLCCQAAGSLMAAQGAGVIINISSIYGMVGNDQRIYQRKGNPERYKPAYYSTTKAGILGLTRYLAAYYAGTDIRVNALTPGGVFKDHDQDFIQAYSSRAILGRMAEKYEMNGALLFLASDASAYMTGGNLVVDGGWTAW